jgi:hypothetical protein
MASLTDPRLRRSACSLLALVVLLAAAACKGVEIMGTAGAPRTGTGAVGGGIGGGGGGSPSSALIGRWARTIVLQAGDGNIYESRTEWEFRADGSAIRRVTSWNVGTGLYDTLIAVAQWTTNGSSLTISYLQPTTGTAVFDWRLVGDVLTIGPDQYARVA